MKKIFGIFLTSLVLFSCVRNHKLVELEKCKILKVESNYIYGGLTGEKEYLLYTNKYKIYSRKRFSVGDTIVVSLIKRED